MKTGHDLNSIIDSINGFDGRKLAEVVRFKSFEADELFDSHSHRRIEINYVKRGKCSMEIGGETVQFNEGEMVIVFSNIDHNFRAGAKGCTLMQLEFMPDIFERYENLLFSQSATLNDIDRNYLKITNNWQITSTVQNIFEELNSEQLYNKMMVVIYYGILLVYISRCLNEVYIVNCRNASLHKIVRFIKDNYSSCISVSSLAQESGISERYMRKLFLKYIGITPNDYINRVRVEKSIELITSGNLKYSIKETGYLCGFKTPQHFNKVFRQITGMTPSVYSKKK